MKLLFSRFGINRTLGSAILSIALLSAFVALATSTKYATTKSSSTATAVATPACTASATYTGSFTGAVAPSEQAKQDWVNFRQSLVPADYDTVTISGTNDTTGRTLTDATIVPQIATAMKTQAAGSWTVGSITWTVGIDCSDTTVCPHNGQVELTASPRGEVACNCDTVGGADYTVRPEICNANWGGVQTPTCGGSSQTMTVTFSGPAVPSCATPPSGMVSWWPAEGDAHDIQDGNDGTLQTGVTFASGKVGQAFEFNGNGGVDVPDADNLDVTTQLTLDAWVNTTDLSDYPMIFSKFNGGNASYELHLQPDGSVRSNVSGDGSSYDVLISGPGVVTTDSWYHVAMTFNAGDWKIYVNGVQVAAKSSSVTSIFQGTSDLFIGRDAGITHIMNGLIDEAELFNRALSGADILSIYNAGCTGKCRSCARAPAGMIGWWPGNGSAEDVQGSNDGTVNGLVTFDPGKVGLAFGFNGNNAANYVDIGNPADLKPTEGITLDAWIYLYGPPDWDGLAGIFTKWGQGAPDNWALWAYKPGSDILLAGDVVTTSGGSFLTGGSIPIGQWTHVAVTYGSASHTQRIYVNGEEVGSDSSFAPGSTVVGTNAEVCIGRECTYQ
ncbi:MAG: hypothetical protein QOE81_2318, partial [Verrucomicrobiota bacterium]